MSSSGFDISQYDPTNPANLGNILTGGQLAPWNIAKMGAQKPFSTPGATIDPNAFDASKGWAAAAANPGVFGEGQRTLADALTAQMNGQGPNLAEAQLRQATNRNLSNAAALQASARGVDPALLARNTAQNQATIAQQAAGQSGIQRLMAQLAAQGQLGSVLAQGKQGELEQAGQANQAAQAGQQLNVQNVLGAAGINAGAQQAANQANTQMMGAGLGALGALFASAGAVIPAYDGGGSIPGVDHGVDERLVMARPGEVVVNQESAAYPIAKPIVEAEHAPAGPRPGPVAPPLTGHPMGRRILDWMRGSGRSFGQPGGANDLPLAVAG